MPPAILGPVLGAAVAGTAGIAAAKMSKPAGPPDISADRKKALGSFAERLAAQEGQYRDAAANNSVLLGPGGMPIKYSTAKRDPNQPLLLR